MDLLLISALGSSGAALAAPLGVLGQERIGRGRPRWLGWANALAAGIMLGVSAVLAEAALAFPPTVAALGALVGISFVFGVQSLPGSGDFWDGDQGGNGMKAGGVGAWRARIFKLAALHAAAEGIAIGVAMRLGVALGLVVAAAMAVHNVPEGAVLGRAMRGEGASLSRAAAATLAAKAGQPLLTIVSLLAVAATPLALPFAAGAAAGALVYLVMSELLPEAYRLAGATSIALVASVAIAVLALFGGGGGA